MGERERGGGVHRIESDWETKNEKGEGELKC